MYDKTDHGFAAMIDVVALVLALKRMSTRFSTDATDRMREERSMSMAAGPVPQSYDGAQRAFHWIMAAAILFGIVIGVSAALLPRGSPRVELLTLHKSLGMSVLVLAVLRVATASSPARRLPRRWRR